MLAPLTSLLVLLSATPTWHDEVLSDDPQVRASAISKLHAKGRPGLYALEDLLRQSADESAHVRVLRALGELGDPGAEWDLRLDLRNNSPKIVAAAIRAAGQLHLKTMARAIVDKFGNPDPDVCAALGEVAAAFPPVADRARAALGSPNSDEQLEGLRVLEAAKLPLDPAVARDLAHSPRAEVALGGATALEGSDPAGAVDALWALVPGPQGAAAVAALGQLATPLALQRLWSLVEPPTHPIEALAALGESEAGVRWLLGRLAKGSLPSAERAAIESALDARPQGATLLVAPLNDSDEGLATVAAARLAAKAAGREVLARCLESLAPQAARCARGLAESMAAGPLVARALQDPAAQVRVLMLAGLAGASPAPTLELLTPLATDPAPEVRAAVAAPLARLEAAALPLLRTLLRDYKPMVRSAAAAQLARLLPPDELHPLALAAVSDVAVRSALIASNRLASADAVRLLLAELAVPDPRERRQAMDRLARYGVPEATAALMDRATNDADPLLREHALALLWEQE